MEERVNPFPNTPFSDRPKFREAADDNLHGTIERFYDIDCPENIVEKGEIAQNISLFSTMFS